MLPLFFSTREVVRLYRCGVSAAPALACSLLLGACATIDIATTPAPTSDARGAPFETVSKDHARVLVPSEAGTALAVLQRRQSDNDGAANLSQRIIMMGDSRTTGENAVEIIFRSAAGSDDFAPITDAEMTDAMATQFDNRPMSVSNRVVANGLGAFTLAIGQQDGENCVFAWQRIKSRPLGAHSDGKQNAVDMRIRLCRTDRTLDQLVASLARFTVIEDGAGDNIDTRQIAQAPARDTVSVTPRAAPHPAHQSKARDRVRAIPVLEAQLAAPRPDAATWTGTPQPATSVPAR